MPARTGFVREVFEQVLDVLWISDTKESQFFPLAIADRIAPWPSNKNHVTRTVFVFFAIDVLQFPWTIPGISRSRKVRNAHRADVTAFGQLKGRLISGLGGGFFNPAVAVNLENQILPLLNHCPEGPCFFSCSFR